MSNGPARLPPVENRAETEFPVARLKCAVDADVDQGGLSLGHGSLVARDSDSGSRTTLVASFERRL